MYAIVEIAGKQYRVEENKNIKVPFLHTDAGGKVEFDRVLFVNNDKGENVIGAPVVEGMKVSATVVEHGRDKKIIVFKKKRRKGYQVKNGHRQQFSLIKIDEIGKGKIAKAPSAQKEAPVQKAKETPKAKPAEKKAKQAAAPKAEPKKTAAPAKPVQKKETAAKKPVAKKAIKTTKVKPTAKKTTASVEKKTAPAKRAAVKKPAVKKAKPAKKKEA